VSGCASKSVAKLVDHASRELACRSAPIESKITASMRSKERTAGVRGRHGQWTAPQAPLVQVRWMALSSCTARRTRRHFVVERGDVGFGSNTARATIEGMSHRDPAAHMRQQPAPRTFARTGSSIWRMCACRCRRGAGTTMRVGPPRRSQAPEGRLQKPPPLEQPAELNATPSKAARTRSSGGGEPMLWKPARMCGVDGDAHR